jgi:CRISPR system Cascade subunit CasE
MYLSKLKLNPRHSQARQDIANPYNMHATLAWAVTNHAEERLLWRLEQVNGDPDLLVQSQTIPDWSALLDRHPDYAIVDATSPKPFEPAFKEGLLVRFRLRANPTVAKFDPEKGRGKRIGLVKLEDQLAWLNRQGKQNGFDVLGAMVSSAERVTARKVSKGGEEGHNITLQSVTYDGHLRIVQSETFLSALQNGLGHAKALGFGLLSIAPAR